MKRRTDIEINDLGNGVRRLSEFGLVNCYLIEGTKRACLIDAGAGIADIAAVVRLLTGKPLTVLMTHAHEDHLGGGVWYPEVRVHPADFRTARLYMHPPVRMLFLRLNNKRRKSHGISYLAAFQREYSPKLLPVNDGDAFDLGGRSIEAYHTPGHSVGSVTYRDTLTGALFVGDNAGRLTTLHYPFADTAEVWLRGAEKTLSLAGDAPIYAGHGERPLTKNDLETLIELGKKIAARGNTKKRAVKTERGEEKYPYIVYRTDRVK